MKRIATRVLVIAALALALVNWSPIVRPTTPAQTAGNWNSAPTPDHTRVNWSS